jgi:hypothetical protein
MCAADTTIEQFPDGQIKLAHELVVDANFSNFIDQNGYFFTPFDNMFCQLDDKRGFS